MFKKDQLRHSVRLLDPEKVREIDGNELLANKQAGEVSAQFVLDLGSALLRETQNFRLGKVFTPEAPITQAMLQNLLQRGNQRVFAQLALGRLPEDSFLATGRVVEGKSQSLALELQVLPVSLAMLEKGKTESYSEQTRLLAAAALSASALPDSLQAGLETTLCSTKSRTVATVTPDHTAPLATVFETFSGTSSTLNSLERTIGKSAPTLGEMTHLHGVAAPVANVSRLQASRTGLAGGMELVTVRMDELHGKHGLFLRHRVNEHGQTEIMTLPDLFPGIFSSELLAQASAALAFTAHIIGDSQREQGVEQTFQAKNVDVPMIELLRVLR